MKRRTRTRPIDYVRDRKHWTALIATARQAVSEPPVGASDELARAAIQARNTWNPPVPYPASLTCGAFTGLLLAYGHERHPERRRELAPALGACGDLLETLIASAERVRSAEAERTGGWLPYADD